jgi:cobalamin-dependent methionine synthase I
VASRGLFELLRREEMMMEPEAGVSALMFHHPDCAYFCADEG